MRHVQRVRRGRRVDAIDAERRKTANPSDGLTASARTETQGLDTNNERRAAAHGSSSCPAPRSLPTSVDNPRCSRDIFASLPGVQSIATEARRHGTMDTAVNRDGPGTEPRRAPHDACIRFNSLSQLYLHHPAPSCERFRHVFFVASAFDLRFPFRVYRHKERVTKALLCSGL